MIRPLRAGPDSPFLEEGCALCKQTFIQGDEVVICPEDGSRHHVHCWRANNNRCTAYGCRGQGVVGTAVRQPPGASGQRPPTGHVRVLPATEGRGLSKIRALPSTNVGCAQSCLLISIALAILLVAIGCFGLWAIADYILLEVLHWPYRDPLSLPEFSLLIPDMARLIKSVKL
jgi:hypothetical protein